MLNDLWARLISWSGALVAPDWGTAAFDNRDGVPHNLDIRGADGTVVFRGDAVTGPMVTVCTVPPLAAGADQFVCTAHPAMTGTLTVK